MKLSSRWLAGFAPFFLWAISAGADTLVIVAGGGSETNRGPATRFQLHEPFGVDFDRAGGMFIVEMEAGQRVLKVDQQGVLSVLAGRGEKGRAGDGGPAAQATFNGLHNLAISPEGDLFLADAFNGRIRKIDAKTGVISTFAGNGTQGFGGDGGPVTEAVFGTIINVALDPQGANLYLADIDNRRIRKINLASSLVTTVAGNGGRGVPPDGAEAKSAPLVDPRAVAVNEQGEIYILERGGHALRFVDAAGRIRTVAGTGKPGNSGDGGNALQATLRSPKHLCIDRDGSVLIADTDNHAIRRYLPREGRIVRVAGTGEKGVDGVGGPPLQVQLNQPHGVTIGPDGKLYVADSLNHRVLRLEK